MQSKFLDVLLCVFNFLFLDCISDYSDYAFLLNKIKIGLSENYDGEIKMF